MTLYIPPASVMTPPPDKVERLPDKVERLPRTLVSLPTTIIREATHAKRADRKKILMPWVEYYHDIGLTNRSIAKRVGLSHTTINRWLKAS